MTIVKVQISDTRYWVHCHFNLNSETVRILGSFSSNSEANYTRTLWNDLCNADCLISNCLLSLAESIDIHIPQLPYLLDGITLRCIHSFPEFPSRTEHILALYWLPSLSCHTSLPTTSFPGARLRNTACTQILVSGSASGGTQPKTLT